MAKVVVGLDLSTNCTGYAVMDYNGNLIAHGRLKSSVKGALSKNKYEKTLNKMLNMIESIVEMLMQYNPDIVVIEEISGNAKNRLGQKTLDGFHWLLLLELRMVLEKIVFYDVTGANGWRKHLNLRLDDADKASNKEAKKLNKQLAPGTPKIPIIGPKHLACRYVNRVYSLDLNVDLNKTDADVADAIAMTSAYVNLTLLK